MKPGVLKSSNKARFRTEGTSQVLASRTVSAAFLSHFDLVENWSRSIGHAEIKELAANSRSFGNWRTVDARRIDATASNVGDSIR